MLMNSVGEGRVGLFLIATSFDLQLLDMLRMSATSTAERLEMIQDHRP